MSIYWDGGLMLFCCIFAAILGAVVGSFLNCAAWRIAHNESFIKGRSRCPKCEHALGALDLIPIFSWLFLRGKCRYCGERVSPRYLLTELFFALITVLCLLQFDLTILCLRNWIFLCCLFLLALVDLESYIIPNGCLIVAAVVWVVAQPFIAIEWSVLWNNVLAAVIFGGGLLVISLIMDKVLKRDSLGGGDIKLFAVVGLYLGIWPTLFTLVLACIFGLVFALLRKRFGNAEKKEFPFGPAIALASALMLLFGSGLVDWYLSIL